jgi:ABC-type multidrug transport system permease subunit
LSWFLIYVLNSLSGYFIHHVLLGNTYKQIASALHADVKDRLWAFIIISISSSFFTFIYSQWRRSATVTEGLKFGLFAGIWITFSEYFSAYASSDAIPLSLTIEWIVLGLLQSCFAGYILALIYNYRNEKPVPTF